MSRYAHGTEVSVDRSVAEIKSQLQRFGATGFGYIEQGDRAAVGFRLDRMTIRIELALPDRNDERFTHTRARKWARSDGEAYRLWEHECRRAWRCLAAVIKAKLIAVQENVSTIENEFLPFIVMGDGQTVGQKMVDWVAEARKVGSQEMLALPEP